MQFNIFCVILKAQHINTQTREIFIRCINHTKILCLISIKSKVKSSLISYEPVVKQYFFQYFEKEQARLEGLESPRTKRSRLRSTLATATATARDRARKMSSSLTGTSTYNINVARHPGPVGGGSPWAGGPVGGAGPWRGGGGPAAATKRMNRTKGSGSNLLNNNQIKRVDTTTA